MSERVGDRTENQSKAKLFASQVLEHVNKTMRGMDEIIRLCLVAFYTQGHILLEGNPGLGKTELVKNLSAALGLDYGRIQFTPDLMPMDIVGVEIPDEIHDGQRKFRFQKGPIFTNLLLADEINRATPKTQSALLEAMAEHQVTLGGTTYPIQSRTRDNYPPVPEGYETLKSPFMVLATQNPIDHEGTYELPEAQSDRFMFKILMPVPEKDVLNAIIDMRTGPLINHSGKTSTLFSFEESFAQYYPLHKSIRDLVPLEIPVREHILNLFLATNHKLGHGEGRKELPTLTELTQYGLGPRATIALTIGSKAWSYFFNETGEQTANAVALAKVALPILRHRVKLKYEWYDLYRNKQELHDIPDNRLHDYYLRDLCLACIPKNAENYSKLFTKAINDVVKEAKY